MRAKLFAVAVLLAACSEQQPAPANGPLWPYRDQVAEAVTFRSGALSSTVGKKARPCWRYWSSGDPRDAEQAAALCDANLKDVQTGLSDYYSIDLTEADTRDPEFWRYVATKARL